MSLVAFKNYDQAARDEMAKSGKALPDGSFPINDEEDLKNALHRIGTTTHPRSTVIAHIRKRARALGAEHMLGEKTAPKASHGASAPMGPSVAAQFSAERTLTPEGNVIRRGKVYEAGPRTDMHGIPFNVDEPDLANMVLNFRPFNVGSGHPEAPHPLDGHLGTVTSLYLGESPSDLYAAVELPPFVDDVLTQEHGDGARVSMVFDRFTKEPIGLDFVDDPNVVDAALTASFARARHDTHSGQRAMQDIHDTATRSGAVCRQSAANASRHEATAVQQVHDISAAHGAQCEDKGKPMTMYANTPETPNPSPNEAAPEKKRGINWRSVWDALFASAEAHEQTDAAFAQNPNDYEANYQDHIGDGPNPLPPACGDACCAACSIGDCSCGDCQACKTNQSLITDANPKRVSPGTGGGQSSNMAAEPVTQNDPAVIEMAQLRAENSQLKANLSRERASRIESEAVAFATLEIEAHRSLPAERDFLIQSYEQAAADDSVLGAVKMANGETSSRTERLKAHYASRPEHWMTKEQMATAMSPDVLTAAMATAKAREMGNQDHRMTPEEKQNLLGMTDYGRNVLKAAGKN